MLAMLRKVARAVTPPVIYDGVRLLRRARGGRAGSRTSDETGGLSELPMHRETVGGMWDEIGRLQFDFLVDQGLKPEHRLLDVGCGSFRGGVHFIPYLDEGHYYGLDASAEILRAGCDMELPRHGLESRKIHLVCNDQFDFRLLGEGFEFAIAQSVFTHLPWNSILRCLVNIRAVLAPDGKFFATFFLDHDGRHRTSPLLHTRGGVTTLPDRDPYHYEFDVFQDLARRAALNLRYFGDWNHPRDQKMLMFWKA